MLCFNTHEEAGGPPLLHGKHTGFEVPKFLLLKKNCSDTRFFSLCVLSNLKSYPFVFICLVVFKVAVNIRDQIPEQELNTF